MIDRKELKKAMIDNDTNVTKLANCLSISKTALSNKINGKSEFKLSEIKTLIYLLHLNQDETYKIFFNQFVNC